MKKIHGRDGLVQVSQFYFVMMIIPLLKHH